MVISKIQSLKANKRKIDANISQVENVDAWTDFTVSTKGKKTLRKAHSIISKALVDSMALQTTDDSSTQPSSLIRKQKSLLLEQG